MSAKDQVDHRIVADGDVEFDDQTVHDNPTGDLDKERGEQRPSARPRPHQLGINGNRTSVDTNNVGLDEPTSDVNNKGWVKFEEEDKSKDITGSAVETVAPPPRSQVHAH